MNSQTKRFLNDNRPYLPEPLPAEIVARQRAIARLKAPDLYAHETSVPEDIWQLAPELAREIENSRRQAA